MFSDMLWETNLFLYFGLMYRAYIKPFLVSWIWNCSLKIGGSHPSTDNCQFLNSSITRGLNILVGGFGYRLSNISMIFFWLYKPTCSLNRVSLWEYDNENHTEKNKQTKTKQNNAEKRYWKHYWKCVSVSIRTQHY